MESNDPRFDPKTAPVWSNTTNQTYSQRTVRAFTTILIIVLVIGAFAGWYFFTNEPQKPSNAGQQNESVVVLTQGTQDQERGPIYNFFYKLFGGADDGLETSQFNLENEQNADVTDMVRLQKHYQNLGNLDDGYSRSVFDVIGSNVSGSEGEDAGIIYDLIIHKETGMARAVIVEKDDSYYDQELASLRFENIIKQQPDGDVRASVTDNMIEGRRSFSYDNASSDNYVSLRNLRDGQVLDDKGEVAGQIDAIIYENAEVQKIFFTLKPILSPTGNAELFSIPFEEINVVENIDGYDIQLTTAQTKSLAQTLYGQK